MPILKPEERHTEYFQTSQNCTLLRVPRNAWRLGHVDLSVIFGEIIPHDSNVLTSFTCSRDMVDGINKRPADVWSSFGVGVSSKARSFKDYKLVHSLVQVSEIGGQRWRRHRDSAPVGVKSLGIFLGGQTFHAMSWFTHWFPVEEVIMNFDDLAKVRSRLERMASFFVEK